MGGGVGVAATGCFFSAQPARTRQNTSAVFLMFSVFARARPLVDGNLGYRLDADTFAKVGQLVVGGYEVAGGAGGGDGSLQIDVHEAGLKTESVWPVAVDFRERLEPLLDCHRFRALLGSH